MPDASQNMGAVFRMYPRLIFLLTLSILIVGCSGVSTSMKVTDTVSPTVMPIMNEGDNFPFMVLDIRSNIAVRVKLPGIYGLLGWMVSP